MLEGKYYKQLPEGKHYKQLPEGKYYRQLPEGKYYRQLPEGKYYRQFPEGKYYRQLPEGKYYKQFPEGKYYKQLPEDIIHNQYIIVLVTVKLLCVYYGNSSLREQTITEEWNCLSMGELHSTQCEKIQLVNYRQYFGGTGQQ